jgi:hypothetical protein
MAELTDDPFANDQVEQLDLVMSAFRDVYLKSAFGLTRKDGLDTLSFYVLPFARNLGVSCCGCFDLLPSAIDSTIAYTLLSYSDITLLVLTVFSAVKRYLDFFLENYAISKDVERLVNDIAFTHCEEPLMSVQLWQSLTETERQGIRLSLRHPNFREHAETPRVIRIMPSDLLTEITPALLRRLPYCFGLDDDQIS